MDDDTDEAPMTVDTKIQVPVTTTTPDAISDDPQGNYVPKFLSCVYVCTINNYAIHKLLMWNLLKKPQK
jgi:hypothetical protein